MVVEQFAGPAAVIVPPPEIDISTANEFGADIADAFAAGARTVTVDFAAVTFCDSSGLKVLINAAKVARAMDRAFVVRNPTRSLLRMADLLQATTLLRLPRPGTAGT